MTITQISIHSQQEMVKILGSRVCYVFIQYPDGGEGSYWVQSLLQGDLREHNQYTQYLNDET